MSEAVREWARQRGYNISLRGRIPARIQEEYDVEMGYRKPTRKSHPDNNDQPIIDHSWPTDLPLPPLVKRQSCGWCVSINVIDNEVVSITPPLPHKNCPVFLAGGTQKMVYNPETKRNERHPAEWMCYCASIHPDPNGVYETDPKTHPKVLEKRQLGEEAVI